MIDLYKVGDNPYDDRKHSLDALLTYTEAHLAIVMADATASQVAFELTAVGNAMEELGGSVSSDTLKLGLQKARVSAKNNFRAGLPNHISRIYGAGLEAFGQKGDEMDEIFPEGREIFSLAKDARLEEKLVTLKAAVTTHSTALGAPMLTLAAALVTDWGTVFSAATTAKGQKTGSATERRADLLALKRALALLRLELGKQLLGQRERLKTLFPQHLLGQPVEETDDEEDGGGEGGGGEGGSAPTVLPITGVSGAGSGEFQVTFGEGGEDADTVELILRRVGTEEEIVLPATPPSQLVTGLVPASTYKLQTRATNAHGVTLSGETEAGT